MLRFGNKDKLMLISLLIFWIYFIGGRTAMPVILLLTFFYLFSLKYRLLPSQDKLEVLGIILAGIIIRIVFILANPNPPIDVYYLSIEGFQNLIKGVNPYTTTYGNPQIEHLFGDPSVQSYPPLMLLLLGVGYLLSDVRFSILMADFGIAYLIYRLFNEDENGLLLMCIYILNPLNVFVMRWAWNESILTVFMLASLFALNKKPSIISPILLGLSFGIKHFSVLFAPFLWRNYDKKQIAISILVGILTYMPFIVISPYDMIYDMLLYFNFVRYDSKSLIPMFLKFFWKEAADVPIVVVTLLSLIRYLVTGFLVTFFALRSKTKVDISYNFALCFFTFLLLSPISNINYFNVLLPFIAVGAGLEEKRPHKS